MNESPRVLVVDDSETNRDILEAMLTPMGCEVSCVANGREAIDAAAQTPYALILMDCQMPHMDGFAATREIRKQEGTERHVPIVALTASSRESIWNACVEAGMDDVIIKPAFMGTLSAVVSKWTSPLDAALLGNLRNELGGPGSPVFLELIDSFLRETELHLHTLEEASQSQQAEQIGREAHIVKGSSSYFGATRVCDLSFQIESLAQSNQLSKVPHHIKQLQEEFQRVRKALQSEVAHGPA